MIGSLSTNALRSPTLGDVDREGARKIAAMRSRIGGAAILLALVALCVPRAARAQEESEESEVEESEVEESEGAQGAATEDEQYEPDQRGEHEEQEMDASPGVATVAASDMEEYGAAYDRRLGLDLQLWLGAGVLGVDAAGGDNLVRSSQRGSIAAAFGVAAGVRVGPVIVGPRLGLSIDASMLLANVALGADVLLLDEAFAPYVRASVGLSIATPLGDRLAAQADADILGLGVEIGVGVRWRASGGFFVGAELTGGWHHLWREAVPSCTAECSDGELDLRLPGESDALSLRLSLTAGWSF